jgi:hypothetical protein
VRPDLLRLYGALPSAFPILPNPLPVLLLPDCPDTVAAILGVTAGVWVLGHFFSTFLTGKRDRLRLDNPSVGLTAAGVALVGQIFQRRDIGLG